MNKLNRMLFFRDQADEASVDGIDDQLCIAADRLVSMSPASDTTIEMLFHSVKNNILMNNEQLTYDKVTLTVKEGDVQEALDALVQTINGHPNSNGFIVIADDCATTDSATSSLDDQTISTVYCHPSITGVASITIAAKLYSQAISSNEFGMGNAAPTPLTAAGELALNTHYQVSDTDAAAYTIPSAAAGRAGDWITVTYITAIGNGALHTYTCTTDTQFTLGSRIFVIGEDATRIPVIDTSVADDDQIRITGLTNGDGGIGTTLKFVNKTGTTNGWSVYAEMEGQAAKSAASATTDFNDS
jgi:hypothetical protein